MRPIDRRTLLCGITIGVLAAASRSPAARAFPTERPPPGVLTQLPGNGNQLALTIDDGASAQVVGAFADFCRDSGTRLTFFANGANGSWSVNAPAHPLAGLEGRRTLSRQHLDGSIRECRKQQQWYVARRRWVGAA